MLVAISRSSYGIFLFFCDCVQANISFCDSYGTTEAGVVTSDGRQLGSKFDPIETVLLDCPSLGFTSADKVPLPLETDATTASFSATVILRLCIVLGAAAAPFCHC